MLGKPCHQERDASSPNSKPGHLVMVSGHCQWIRSHAVRVPAGLWTRERSGVAVARSLGPDWSGIWFREVPGSREMPVQRVGFIDRVLTPIRSWVGEEKLLGPGCGPGDPKVSIVGMVLLRGMS